VLLAAPVAGALHRPTIGHRICPLFLFDLVERGGDLVRCFPERVGAAGSESVSGFGRAGTVDGLARGRERTVNRDRTALVAAIVMALGACAGSGSEATCEQALEHTASLAVARASPEGKPSPHAADHHRVPGPKVSRASSERAAEVGRGAPSPAPKKGGIGA
jgi:hypothetical protein